MRAVAEEKRRHRPWGLLRGSSYLAVAIFSWVLVGAVGTSAQPRLTEYEVKAAFLYNFTKYVEWPDSCFSNARAPFVLGVFGQNPFDPELLRQLEQREVGEHRFEVRVVDQAAEVREARILFVPANQTVAAGKVLQEVDLQCVLVVGEGELLFEHNGMIQFFSDSGRVRLKIDPGRAEQAGLRISSKLLNLAETRRGG